MLSNGSTASGGRRPRSSWTSFCEHGLAGGERVELVEVELGPQELADDRLDLRVERLDVDASGGFGDPNFASSDDPVQPALVPEVREVRAERPVAGGRELECVRLWKAERRHALKASAAAAGWS